MFGAANSSGRPSQLISRCPDGWVPGWPSLLGMPSSRRYSSTLAWIAAGPAPAPAITTGPACSTCVTGGVAVGAGGAAVGAGGAAVGAGGATVGGMAAGVLPQALRISAPTNTNVIGKLCNL